MRIVQVVGEFAPQYCGVAHYAARLARELAASDVEVAIASHPSGVASPVEFLPLRSPGWSLATLVELLVVARRWRADWLHLQYAPGSYGHRRVVGLLPLLAKLFPGRSRIATTVHEYGGWPVSPPRVLAPFADAFFSVAERGGWFDREALALLGLSDLAIATNPDHQKTVRSCSDRLARRLRVIPIGPNVGPDVAPEATREAARAALGVSEDRFVAVFFGFVHPVKGIETLLEAMRTVRRTRPAVALWIVGGVHSLALRGEAADSYQSRVQRMIAELGLSDVVELTGYLRDGEAARRLRAADLAVLPFNHGITLKSGSLITCLSYQLPVLATTGGDLSMLRHGENVWLVPPRDPGILADAFCSLASDRDLRRQIGSAGATLAAQFGWPSIARRHVDSYLNAR